VWCESALSLKFVALPGVLILGVGNFIVLLLLSVCCQVCTMILILQHVFGHTL